MYKTVTKMKMVTADTRMRQMSRTINHTKCFSPRCHTETLVRTDKAHGEFKPSQKASETAKWLKADCSCFMCHITATVSGVCLRAQWDTVKSIIFSPPARNTLVALRGALSPSSSTATFITQWFQENTAGLAVSYIVKDHFHMLLDFIFLYVQWQIIKGQGAKVW